MPQTVLTTPTAESPEAVTPTSSGLVEEAAFYPPFPIRWHHVARNPHFWSAYGPRTGSDPGGWSLLQYGTRRPTQPVEGDVFGWAEGGYCARFTAPAGLPRLFTISMCYVTDLLTRPVDAAYLKVTQAFLSVRGPGFYLDEHKEAPLGRLTVVSLSARLQAGITYSICAGAAIDLGVRNFNPNHWRAYAEMAGRLLHIRVERYLWEPPVIERAVGAPEEATVPGEGQEPPEGEILDETEVDPEEMAARTRKELDPTA